MQKDERDLLDVLRFELQFLNDGGYGRSPRTPWRPQYIFEDSLTCMNFDSKENPAPCSDCVLMQLVPPEQRGEEIPCRHIPFNVFGETLASLYRNSTQQEIEEMAGEWLQATIQRLEEERMATREERNRMGTASAERTKGTPLYQKQHPKCANPVCPAAFHWTGGGKFFRFRPEMAAASGSVWTDAPTDAPTDASADTPVEGGHGVKHYWLCERCSLVFTLVHEEEYGVVLKLLWPELPTTEGHKELSAA